MNKSDKGLLLVAILVGVWVLAHELSFSQDTAVQDDPVMQAGYRECVRSMGAVTDMEIVLSIETCAAQWGQVLTEEDYP